MFIPYRKFCDNLFQLKFHSFYVGTFRRILGPTTGNGIKAAPDWFVAKLEKKNTHTIYANTLSRLSFSLLRVFVFIYYHLYLNIKVPLRTNSG